MAIHQVLYVFLPMIAMANCAKILVMVTTPSPSLLNLYTPIIEGLCRRKHDVTVQTILPLKKSIENLKVLHIQPYKLGGDEEMTKDFLMNLTEASTMSEVYSFISVTDTTCAEYLQDESTKTLLTSGRQFDIVVADGFSNCVLSAANLLGKHIVDVLTSGNYPWAYSDVPAPPSYVPNYYRRMPSKMTFWQRVTSAVDIAAFRLLDEFVAQPSYRKSIPKYLPEASTVEEMRDRVAFTLTYGDPVMYSPRPSMPTVIDVGGLHCKDAKPLPKELREFVESSGDDGFIVFGLGTNMKSKFLPRPTLDAILTAFSRLKQKVIWKFETQLENLPKNVKITKWMPQQDLLGHPKIRLFISHAGLLSMQEAVYHGVPVIGMPFFMDQAGNIGRIQEIGMGEYLNFFNLTADGLYELITLVLNNPSYHANAWKYSRIFKDQPIKPIHKAIFWIEYILRHDGARHFRPAARDLNFFQYFLLDVIAFLLLVVIVATAIFIFILLLLMKKLFPRNRSDNGFKKKKL